MLELEEVLQNGQEVLSGNQQGDDTRLGCVVEFRVLNFRRYVQNVPNESGVFYTTCSTISTNLAYLNACYILCRNCLATR